MVRSPADVETILPYVVSRQAPGLTWPRNKRVPWVKLPGCEGYTDLWNFLSYLTYCKKNDPLPLLDFALSWEVFFCRS